MRSSANQPLIAKQVTLRPTNYTDIWWITSAVEFLHQQGLSLTLNNPSAHRSTILLHQKFQDMQIPTANALYLYSIASHQELYMQGDQPPPELSKIIKSLQLAPLDLTKLGQLPSMA